MPFLTYIYTLLSFVILQATATNPSSNSDYRKGFKLPITRVRNEHLRSLDSPKSLITLSNQNKFSYLVPTRCV
ncbi:hypothetical protein L218DRAFT_960535 [Marasmius fiardii PR-910]|nr:hypothetical protein L218DRAFT_960535 [Marasmius fiardii PR-910]